MNIILVRSVYFAYAYTYAPVKTSLAGKPWLIVKVFLPKFALARALSKPDIETHRYSLPSRS